MTIPGGWRRAAHGAGLLGPNGESGTTIFAEVSALALQHDAINLGQGFPDEDGPTEVLEAARQAIRDGINQYPPGIGNPLLRTAIAAHQKRFYGIGLDRETQVLVTAGATEAIAATLLALIEPGDEVLTFEPFYDAYGAGIELAGGIHRTVPLRLPDFQPDLDELRAAVTDRTRIILVNSPNNPTGSILTDEALHLLIELAHRHDAIIVTDEVYEHLTFGVPHHPIASRPGGFERTVTISSGGKTFSTTGWKIGWVTGPAELVTAILAVKQFLTFVNGAPFQPAIAVGLGLPDSYFTGIAATLAAKRDLLAAGLTEAGFAVTLPQAGYFIIADAAPHGVDDAAAVARSLPAEVGVAAIPFSAFCHPELARTHRSLLRFAFCKRENVLAEAVRRLHDAR
ncbi:MAG: aminotransferase class I/II-fold pyridoxal phosphate-dependent enzyme [Microbacteriaceae bacterium]